MVSNADDSSGEERTQVIGPTLRGVIVVVFTERHGDVIRIINARLASKREIQFYREEVR